MASRPHINKGIEQLEGLYESQNSHEQTLASLFHELSHRKTKRAQYLMVKVKLAQGKIDKKTPEEPMLPLPEENQRTIIKAPAASPQKAISIPEPFDFEALKITPIDRPLPPITNQPKEILHSWTAMEVLSPANFRSPRDLVGGEHWRIADIENGITPWENGGERSKPNNRLYYQIILGSVAMEPSISALLKVYTDSRDERPQARGEAVLATVMLEKDGCPVEQDAISISSFGWGVPVALSGNLSALSKWPQAEKALTQMLSDHLIKRDSEGQLKPLTWDSINAAYELLINAIGLDQSLSTPPSFIVRTYQYFKNPEPPESILLNSFFLNDLGKATEMFADGTATQNLKRYLGALKPQSRRNLMNDEDAIEFALEPNKFPLGAWPANGRHPLVMLQQCAVNLGLNDLKSDGILAVNGPPGTGKTTLLRDVIAAIVTERAQDLINYDDPEKAFNHSGQKISRGRAFIHLYGLDEKVRGREIIVASSNNKAVENVSTELPSQNAVAEDAPDLRYFKTLSDNLLDTDTWGAIAAVLGNGGNRAKFKQKFWWDDDFGLQTYLQQASGTPKFVTDNEGDEEIQRPPHIIANEDPPNGHSAALRRWKIMQREFRTKLKETTKALADLQSAFELRKSIKARLAITDELQGRLPELESHYKNATNRLRDAENELQKQEEIVGAIADEKSENLEFKPSFFRRLFNWSAYTEWKQEHQEVLSRLLIVEKQLKDFLSVKDHCRAELKKVDGELEKLRSAIDSESTVLATEQMQFDRIADQYKGSFVDDTFLDQDYHKLQISAPWLDKETARLRQDLFEAAMLVHKAFVDAAAKPIRHNLNALMDSFGTRSLGSPERDALIPELWSTLFLVVPVISTTFASVSRMFGSIDTPHFGWLLIDEAGQALPQAAIGAIMRTRRAVVVGDPIQIEPVVVIPDRLTDAICKQFGVDSVIYSAPAASAQTLADSATGYFGTFETKFGTREVGVPLLVHRRCSDPMFSISNAIAYENLMVQAKPIKPSAIRECLGTSRWIDIKGSGNDKWCAEEGEAVLSLLHQLKASGCELDLYIVTPFVIVQDNMRRRLLASGLLDDWVKEPRNWVREHVGTVHTVQGREAEAVIFILGAPKTEHRGARNWAGGQPNLANVAMTRAKEAIYVIGNANHWKSAGVFEALHNRLKLN